MIAYPGISVSAFRKMKIRYIRSSGEATDALIARVIGR
jgi:hypothetical protein